MAILEGSICLNSRQNLVHANSRLPIVLIIQDGQADGAARENVGMKKSPAAGMTRV
jgi:hypothetical protein